MLQRCLQPHGHLHHTPLFAGGMDHPRAARNGPLRREGAAETTSWVPGPRNAFLQKLCICAEHRRRSTETITGPQNDVADEIGAGSTIAI